MKSLALAFVLFAAACGPGSPGGPTMGHMGAGADATPQSSSVASTEILAREPLSNSASVKHILISWKDLGEAFSGHQDERAQKRTKAEAEAEVKSLVGQLKAGGDFETLMKASSEDVGSAASNRAFTVTPDAQLVIEFRQLSLRLNVGEIGVVQSDFGFHIIKRYPN
ncbi:MAG: peptidylprolyl isomerase [Polyangiales bacterium]